MVLFIIIWGSWLLSEFLLNRFSRSHSPHAREWDKNSLRVMWITILLSITLGVLSMIFFPLPIGKSYAIGYAGLLLIVCGAGIRFTAIRQLGKYFTVDLAIHDQQQLVKNGIYTYLRHPSYAGSLLSFFGLGISFNNWLSVLVIIIPIFLSFNYRMKVEERLLLQQFGEEYREYQKITKRVIPFIY